MNIKQFLIISGLLENKQEAENMAVEENKGGGEFAKRGRQSKDRKSGGGGQ